jgi:branched-chain amino acid aminotransferase
VPPQCLDPKTKNRSRLHWRLADQQTHAVDAKAVTLLLDLDGNITDCAGSNFVLVRDRTICSPTRRNILWGISLETVKELAPKVELEFVERDLQPYDVVNADEAWLTTTPYCVAPCTKCNDTPIGEGRPGPLWRKMIGAWSGLVGLDVEQQVLAAR